MEPDFIRIRREIDKLHPNFPQALDRAFKLMKQHQLERGGDRHHGLMRSIWPKYKDFKRSPWNLVRLPRGPHVEVHVLMAAAFVGTKWFGRLNAARIIAAHAVRPCPLHGREEEIKNLALRMTVSKAAKELRVTRATLQGFLVSQMGFPWPRQKISVRLLDGKKAKIRSLLRQGASCRKAAKTLGVERKTLSSFVKDCKAVLIHFMERHVGVGWSRNLRNPLFGKENKIKRFARKFDKRETAKALNVSYNLLCNYSQNRMKFSWPRHSGNRKRSRNGQFASSSKKKSK